MITPEEQMQILKGAITDGYKGPIYKLIDEATIQKSPIASNPIDQEQGLRGSDGSTSMSFAQSSGNFNTEKMDFPIDIRKYDREGNLVRSYDKVPPGIKDLEMGNEEGTVLETPSQYSAGGVKDDKKGNKKGIHGRETVSTTQGSYYYNRDGTPMSNIEATAINEGRRELSQEHFEEFKETITDPVNIADVVGATGIPIVSEAGDAVSAGISHMRGDKVARDASIAGIVAPFAGGAIIKQGIKQSKKVYNVLDSRAGSGYVKQITNREDLLKEYNMRNNVYRTDNITGDIMNNKDLMEQVRHYGYDPKDPRQVSQFLATAPTSGPGNRAGFSGIRGGSDINYYGDFPGQTHARYGRNPQKHAYTTKINLFEDDVSKLSNEEIYDRISALDKNRTHNPDLNIFKVNRNYKDIDNLPHGSIINTHTIHPPGINRTSQIVGRTNIPMRTPKGILSSDEIIQLTNEGKNPFATFKKGGVKKHDDGGFSNLMKTIANKAVSKTATNFIKPIIGGTAASTLSVAGAAAGLLKGNFDLNTVIGKNSDKSQKEINENVGEMYNSQYGTGSRSNTPGFFGSMKKSGGYRKRGIRKFHEGGEYIDVDSLDMNAHMQEPHHAGQNTGDDTQQYGPNSSNPYGPPMEFGASWSNQGGGILGSGFGLKGTWIDNLKDKALDWGKGVWDRSSTLGKVGIGAAGILPAIGIGSAAAGDWSGFKNAFGFKKGGVKKYGNGGLDLSIGAEGNLNCTPGIGSGCGSTESALSLKPQFNFNYNTKSGMLGMEGGADLQLAPTAMFGGYDTREGAPIIRGGLNYKIATDPTSKQPIVSTGLRAQGKVGFKRRNMEGAHDWSAFNPGFEVGAYGNYDIMDKKIQDIGIYGSYGPAELNIGYNPTQKMMQAGLGLRLGKRQTGGFQSPASDLVSKYLPHTQMNYDEMLRRQRFQESSFNPEAVSPAGAKGLAQFMPVTIKDMRQRGFIKDDFDPFNPDHAIKAQTKYMNWISERPWIKGEEDVKRAKTLAAYNMGPERLHGILNLMKKDGVDIYNNDEWIGELPNYHKDKKTEEPIYESRDYVNRILFSHGDFEVQYKKALNAPGTSPLRREKGGVRGKKIKKYIKETVQNLKTVSPESKDKLEISGLNEDAKFIYSPQVHEGANLWQEKLKQTIKNNYADVKHYYDAYIKGNKKKLEEIKKYRKTNPVPPALLKSPLVAAMLNPLDAGKGSDVVDPTTGINKYTGKKEYTPFKRGGVRKCKYGCW